MTRMQLIRTPGSWKPSASEYRNVTNVYRIALKLDLPLYFQTSVIT